jgi:hypothetical protein
MESKTHAKKDWLIFQNLGKRLSIDETAFQWRTLYYFDQQQQKERKQ